MEEQTKNKKEGEAADPNATIYLQTQLVKKEKMLTYILHQFNEEIGQTLALVRMNLSAIETNDTEVAEKLKINIDLIGKTIIDIRRIVKCEKS